MSELDGCVALVTGGSRGIGRAVCLDLATAGAHIAFTFRSDERAACDTVKAIEAIGRSALALRADGTAPEAAAEAVTGVIARFGRLDILVNNAGINRDGVCGSSPTRPGTRSSRRTLPQRSASPAPPSLRCARSTAAASSTSRRSTGFTKSVAREVGSFGITANVVAPGLIETEMLATMPEDARARSLAETVIGPLGTPEDVAAAVTFLASPRARHIAGVVLQVDGGQRL